MMALIRWFGLDTVLCVVALQLFCQTFIGGVTYGYICGLGVSTSLVYMVDRWVDGTLDPHISSFRHIIYQQQKPLFMVSVILLGLASFYFWMQMVDFIQFRLVLAVVWFCFHIILLRFTRYFQFKLWVVAGIFSWVMVAGTFSLSMFLLLFSVTFLNLLVHDCIEIGKFKWVIFLTFWLFCILISIQLLSGWIIFVFSLTPVLYIPLIQLSNQLDMWYELGELIYALPFLVAYGLMI